MRNIKSKKKSKHVLKKTSKYYGGLNRNINSYNSNSGNNNNGNNSNSSNIMNYVDERHKEVVKNTFVNRISDKVFLLFEELLIEYINVLGRLLGVDISNPQDVNDKLEKIKIIVTDPEIRTKVKIIVERLAIIMETALDAAEPYAKPLGEKISNIYINIASEFDGSLVRIAKNVIKAVPGLNVIASLIDLSATAATSIVDVYNAKLKMQGAIANTMESVSINYNDLLKEKSALLNRTNESINQFSQSPP